MERAEDLAGASETVKVRAKAGELAEVSEQWKAQGSVWLKDSKMVLHWDQESEERMVKTWESLLAQLSVLPSAKASATMSGSLLDQKLEYSSAQASVPAKENEMVQKLEYSSAQASVPAKENEMVAQ